MKKSGSKVLIIFLIIIALLAIAGGIFAYGYFGTDMFKSSQELFAKYLTQDLSELSQIASFDKINELEEKLKQNKHEETTTISYSEDGAQPNGTATIEIQKDPINQKTYGNISLEAKNSEEILKLEYMNEGNIYSVRFTNAVQQFLSIENNNLKEFATNLGVDEETVEQIPDTIDFEKFSLEKLKFTEEEKQIEIKKYSELLYNNIPKEKYTKSKDTVITVDGKTITTNAYILTLNMQDINNLAIKLLETIKQDEILLSKFQAIDEMTQEYLEESLENAMIETIQEAIDELTAKEIIEEGNIVITVYEQNEKTVRVKIEQEFEHITLDTFEVEGKKQVDVNYTNIDEDNTQLSNGVTFIKENDNKLTIEFNSIDGEEKQNNELNIELIENDNNVKLNIAIGDEEGKTLITRDINFVDEIDYKVTLNNSNNIVINTLTMEQISNIFTLVGDKLNTEYVEEIQEEHLEPFKLIVEPITTIMMYNQLLENVESTDFSEAELAMFNSKFEAYEGSNVSASQVNSLLNTVLAHNTQEAVSGEERYVTITGDVTLEVDATTITRVPGNEYYSVECKKDENGLINEIVIEEGVLDMNLEEISYTSTEEVSITKTYSPTNIATVAPTMPEDTENGMYGIIDTGKQITGILRTIGIIAIVILLF